MFETEKLYYEKPLALTSDGKILAIRESGENTDIVLDRTVFYPEGGGQPCDKGELGGQPVLEVIDDEKGIIHRVKGHPSFAIGDTIAMRVDEARRRYHSQQHSGQHLLSAILERNYGIHTIGFHLGTEYCTIDVTSAGMDARTLADIEAAADTFIAGNHPYVIHVCPPEDPESFPIRKKLPPGEAVVRIVEIAGYDWVACCGTHVASAGDLRVLKILSAEKYKGNTRLYFVSGDKAIGLLRERDGVLKGIAAYLGSSIEGTPERVSTLAHRCSALEADRTILLRQRAELEIELALDDTADVSQAMAGKPAPSPRKPLRFTYTDRNADGAFETAKAGAARGVAVVVFSVPDLTVCALAPALPMAGPAAGPAGLGKADGAQGPTRKPNGLGAALRPLLQQYGGKGGGGVNNFRAVFNTAENAEAFAQAASRFLA